MGQANFQPTWAFIKKPPGYPSWPAVGKQEMIWNTNHNYLHTRLSPYADYDSTLFGGFTKEPFYWIGIEDAGKGLSGLKMTEAKFDGRLFPLGSAPIDVIRVAKFLGSGRGIPWLAKQFLLQTASPYNERRIYNPTSPLIAAGMGLALGSVRPERSFDTSGGLVGMATTLLGSAGSTIFGPPKTNPVSGTTLASNPDALPSINKTTATKALLRAGDALRAKTHLTQAWQGKGSKRPSLLGVLTSMFQNFIPQKQDAKYRSDEATYGLMIGAGQAYFTYKTRRGGTLDFHQLFIGGGSISRPEGDYPPEAARLFINPDGTPKIVKVLRLPSVGSVDGKVVGYSVDESTDKNSPGYRYGDAMGVQKSKDYEASDVMIQYKYYTDDAFPTKDPDKDKADTQKINETLKNTVKAIREASEGTYKFDDSEPGLVRVGSFTYDYNRLIGSKKQTTGKPSAKNQPLSTISIYRNSGVRVVTSDMVDSPDKSLKLPTNGKFDAINTLKVLDKHHMKYELVKGQPEWKPYNDDQIALYFYDVVNEKYIPFRASIKGLSEIGNATWEELPFIGRADRVYSYGGFNRNANFTIQIVISSIAELVPTWQRINYMHTAIKPSNYTSAELVLSGNKVTDRFMIPPMFMLTLGDFYREQPILIQSVTVTVPDDASWETLNEDNSPQGWNYLANMMHLSGDLRFGQFPREVDLAFSIVLLEKERAVVGGVNFGHAPRNEDFNGWNTNAVPTGGEPNKLNKALLVDVVNPGFEYQ